MTIEKQKEYEFNKIIKQLDNSEEWQNKAYIQLTKKGITNLSDLFNDYKQETYMALWKNKSYVDKILNAKNRFKQCISLALGIFKMLLRTKDSVNHNFTTKIRYNSNLFNTNDLNADLPVEREDDYDEIFIDEDINTTNSATCILQEISEYLPIDQQQWLDNYLSDSNRSEKNTKEYKQMKTRVFDNIFYIAKTHNIDVTF